MDNQSKKTYKNMLVGGIVLLLIFAEVVLNVLMLLKFESTKSMVMYSCNLVCAILIMFYVSYSYKTPHGNLLKFVLLIFALAEGVKIFSEPEILPNVVRLLIVIIAAYLSGRLDKIDKNKWLFVDVAALLVVLVIVSTLYLSQVNILDVLIKCSALVNWIALFITYVFRYKDHKLAGEMEQTEE